MDYLVEAFAETRRWAKIVGILFMVTFAISFLNLLDGVAAGLGNIVMSIFTNLLPGLFLFRYANAVAEAEEAANPTEDLEIACLNQGRYFLVSGIVMTIAIVLGLLGIIIAIGFGMAYG